MIDFIPVELYTQYFNYAILFLVIVASFQSFSVGVFRRDIVQLNVVWGIAITILIIFYMGLRPVNWHFGDTINYAAGFYQIQQSPLPFQFSWGEGEWIFRNLMSYFAKYSNINIFFLSCSFIYVGALWLAMYRMFKWNYYIPLLVLFSMFTFWSYGVNGIRNGMGASLFILALSYVNNIPAMITIALIASGIHKSIYIMIAAAAISWFVNNSKIYLASWICCVLLSYSFGQNIQAYLNGMSDFTGDERFSGYLTGSNMVGETVQAQMSFRFDFLLYSCMGVLTGYYFIFRRGFRNEFYRWLYNIFLITNSFWILIIRAAYSNRFAQISWFLMPLVMIYPFMKDNSFRNNEKTIGLSLIMFYLFTFYFNIIK